jgi:hypothetical protein
MYVPSVRGAWECPIYETIQQANEVSTTHQALSKFSGVEKVACMAAPRKVAWFLRVATLAAPRQF